MTSSTSMVALLLLLGHVQCASLPPFGHVKSTDDEEQSSHRWLDDFDTVSRQDEEGIYDVMQADSPAEDDTFTDDVSAVPLAVDRTAIARFPVADDYHDDDAPRCPPPILPVAIISSWCSAASGFSTAHRCQTDGDCQSSATSSTSSRKRKCCHNGCRRVCAVPIDPAPYIDWKREPQTRLTSGKSWLIQGPDEQQEVEWCSTSYVYDDVTADEEPLLCPSGYTCYIDDPGDVINGIPNRGRCVPELADSSSAVEAMNFKMTVSQTTANNSCAVSNALYANGEKFSYENHTCTCEDGSVMCRVGKKTSANSATKRRVSERYPPTGSK